MRRQRGDSMRPASAHAGQITNGGTATEPNGVASPAQPDGRNARRSDEDPLDPAGQQADERRHRQDEHRHRGDDADP